MNRTITSVQYKLNGPEKIVDPMGEIRQRVQNKLYRYLLAHADDGVTWGIVQNGKLALSSDASAFPRNSPQFRDETLWDVRLFGKDAEWFLWRSEDGWQAREIVDNQGAAGEAFTESFILWGTNEVKRNDPFTLVREADLGIRHAPPLKWKGRHQFRLFVKHYVEYDDSGVVYVKFSRLAGLSNGDEK